MDLLAALAAEKERAEKDFKEAGLSAQAFGSFWKIKDDATLRTAAIDAKTLAREIDDLLKRFGHHGPRT